MPGIPLGLTLTLLTPPPSISALADELYASLEPFNFDDARQGWPHLYYCEALIGAAQPIADLVRDTDEGPGWSPLVDVDRCPPFALPWLAQTNGTVLTPGMTADEQRATIRDEPGFRRGTLRAIVAAGQKTLTGSRSVLVKERDGGAYQLTVLTFTDETPDPAVTEAAIRAQKPAGIVLTYDTTARWTYAVVAVDFDTISDVDAAFADYAHFRDDDPI